MATLKLDGTAEVKLNGKILNALNEIDVNITIGPFQTCQQSILPFAEIKAIVESIKYKEAVFILEERLYDAHKLTIKFPVKDRENGFPIKLHHGKDLLFSLPDEEAIVKEVFTACKELEEHECSELFYYKGKRPFDPHPNYFDFSSFDTFLNFLKKKKDRSIAFRLARRYKI